MKGYKITNKDMTCLNYQYELNKEFILDTEKEGKLEICESGFHFCKKMEDCFDYYNFYNGERLFEIETLGEIITEGNKSVTDKIIFHREIFLTKEELYIIYSDSKFNNEGKNNIGNNNQGKNNIGNGNQGNNNEGNGNQGNNNIGNYNEGHGNQGKNNKGNYNIGNGNIGNNNKGNYNYEGYLEKFINFIKYKIFNIKFN